MHEKEQTMDKKYLKLPVVTKWLMFPKLHLQMKADVSKSAAGHMLGGGKTRKIRSVCLACSGSS